MKKKQGNDFDFASKTQKIAKLQFPESSSERFIVRTNKDGVGFQWKVFEDLEKLGFPMDRQTFENTINGATRICRNLYREKQMEENKDFTKGFQSLLIVAVLLILIAFIFLLVLIYGHNDMGLLYAAVAVLCVATLLTMIVVFKIFTLHPTFMNLDAVTYNAMNEYFNQQNMKIEAKGYRWVLDENLHWVELQKT